MADLELPGPEAVEARREARKILARFEKDIFDLADDAREYLVHHKDKDRVDVLAIYFRDSIEDLGNKVEEVDLDQTLASLVVCVWLLAEAQDENARLRGLLTGTLDGNRRSGHPGT